MRSGRVVTAFLVAFGAVATPLAAQEGQRAPEEQTISVYLDCQTYYGCQDFDFFRRQIGYVDWVRDRQDADVHVLVSSQATGGGGQRFDMSFIGGKAFDGHDEELTASTSGDATSDEIRRTLARKLKIGLVAYLLDTPVAERLRVSLQGSGGADTMHAGPRPGGPSERTSSAEDPWDYWVFQLRASGYAQVESSTRYSRYSGSVSADRTTDAWRIGLGANYYRYEQRYELSTGTATSLRKDWGVNGVLVRSVGAQWAVGIKANAGSSTYNNQHLDLKVQTGVEYDFFPYGESSRRSLTLRYLVGPSYFDYEDRTIYGYMSETRAQQSLTGTLALVQPWGSWSTSVSAADYLGEGSKYHTSVFGNVNVRLFKGFSINLFGNYTWLHDQLYISAAGLTDEEILLQQRQLSTQFQYYTSVSIQYRFGSIFNNVVNPRFGGSSSGNIVIMG